MNHKIAAITALLVIGGVAACDPAATDSGSKDSSPKATASSDSAAKKPAATTATVPNFVGMGLQSAQDTAQKSGFYNLASHDALGRARNQILDRDWKVCSQNVKAGAKQPTDAKLDFGAVKLAEKCPAEDQKEPTAAGGAMPNFKGKSVKAARDALDGGTSITVNDSSGDSRFILVESNWKVCSQTPAAGAKLNGQPVTLGAVKFEETCP
ncbi:PASTA domain-containing protein [Streptomyces sp. NPDC046978]|uniref:PASTA domain-containing protein n=1 Tax=unclassified Streptomyces TaxID=2593676 RepID=UPI0033DF71C0